jgi:hypothetical protein
MQLFEKAVMAEQTATACFSAQIPRGRAIGEMMAMRRYSQGYIFSCLPAMMLDFSYISKSFRLI